MPGSVMAFGMALFVSRAKLETGGTGRGGRNRFARCLRAIAVSKRPRPKPLSTMGRGLTRCSLFPQHLASRGRNAVLRVRPSPLWGGVGEGFSFGLQTGQKVQRARRGRTPATGLEMRRTDAAHEGFPALLTSRHRPCPIAWRLAIFSGAVPVSTAFMSSRICGKTR